MTNKAIPESTISLKGGVGKSTLATNLTVIRAAQGFDVLLVDADEQRTSSDFTLIRNEALADKGGAAEGVPRPTGERPVFILKQSLGFGR